MAEQTFKLAYACLTYEQHLGGMHPETMKVEVQDDGGGPYLQLTTEQWSIDSPEELTNLLADFQRRIPELEADSLGAWPLASKATVPAEPRALPTLPPHEEPPF